MMQSTQRTKAAVLSSLNNKKPPLSTLNAINFDEKPITPKRGPRGEVLSFEELLERELQEETASTLKQRGAQKSDISKLPPLSLEDDEDDEDKENRSEITDAPTSVFDLTEADVEDVLANDRENYRQQWEEKKEQQAKELLQFQLFEKVLNDLGKKPLEQKHSAEPLKNITKNNHQNESLERVIADTNEAKGKYYESNNGNDQNWSVSDNITLSRLDFDNEEVESEGRHEDIEISALDISSCDHSPLCDFSAISTSDEVHESISNHLEYQNLDKSKPPSNASKLLKSLFPGLNSNEGVKDSEEQKVLERRKDKENANGKQVAMEELNNDTGDKKIQGTNNDLDTKLKELEEEIKRYNKLNKHLLSSQEKFKKLSEELELNQKKFSLFKEQETKKMSAFFEEEKKKLEKEKKNWERFRKTTELLPNKKERQEIETLKQEKKAMEDDFKSREFKWNLSMDRLKKRMEDLGIENRELKESIQILEKERVTLWDKLRSCAMEGIKKTKNIPPNEEKGQMIAGYDENDPRRPFPTYERKLAEVELKEHPGSVVNEIIHSDGKVQREYQDKSQVLCFRNGTTKFSRANGQIIFRFMNGDTKEIYTDHRVVYTYAQVNTVHTTFGDGLEVVEFANGQIEKRHPNGTTEIIFPDKTVKRVFKNGGEVVVFPDGTVQTFDGEQGVRKVEYSDGSKEVYCSEYRERMFVDGVIKRVYANGYHETRYPDGRIRVKDAEGRVVRCLESEEGRHVT